MDYGEQSSDICFIMVDTLTTPLCIYHANFNGGKYNEKECIKKWFSKPR